MDTISKSIRKQLLERKNTPQAPPTEIEDLDHHDEESTLLMHDMNVLNNKVQYLTSLNTDMVEFLHSLVKTLDHDDNVDISDARRDFTVLLNRSGRRKFYQQTKRL
jgi:hypothetical protein|tara:strand:- start:1347 stop:1664 length:318 start_codon:yes stop_codon:yes gene_type:complete